MTGSTSEMDCDGSDRDFTSSHESQGESEFPKASDIAQDDT